MTIITRFQALGARLNDQVARNVAASKARGLSYFTVAVACKLVVVYHDHSVRRIVSRVKFHLGVGKEHRLHSPKAKGIVTVATVQKPNLFVPIRGVYVWMRRRRSTRSGRTQERKTALQRLTYVHVEQAENT